MNALSFVRSCPFSQLENGELEILSFISSFLSVVVRVLTKLRVVSMPVTRVNSKEVAEVMRALVAQSHGVCGAVLNAVSERPVAAVELKNEFVVSLVRILCVLPLQRDNLSAL